jgi:hypothetical protein
MTQQYTLTIDIDEEEKEGVVDVGGPTKEYWHKLSISPKP